MRKQQGNMLAALMSTRSYINDHATTLGTRVNPAVRKKLDDAIAELSNTVTAQDQFTRDRSGAFAVQAASRTALLRDHMTPIAKIAKAELSHLPELVKLTPRTRKLSVQQLAAHADGMAESARPHAQVFIDAGLEPDFVDQLRSAADRMRAASLDGAKSRVRIKGTTSSLTQKLSRARTVVHMLDAFVKKAAGDDKGLIDSWNVAKRVVKSSGATRTTTTVGSIPAVTTPAPATLAAAA